MIFWRRSLPLLIAAAFLLNQGCSTSDPSVPDLVDFNFHVKPILSDRCFACHGPDENSLQAGLRLHLESGAKEAALESGGHAIVPGSLRRSQLYHRITAKNPDERMPPQESNLTLTAEEISILGKWIEQGATWEPHWAFISPEAPPPPEIVQTDWPYNEIDHFVLARLEKEGLSPSPEASKETLIRRVTFDLTGLPPTLDEIDAFLEDSSATAYENLVSRLLSSESYGEHMAAEWMDIARYADTHGYQNDRERRMWPWRDWVIEAFNDNMAFDEFGTWQLAGDLMPDATREQQLATAFNRNHRQTNEGGSIEEEFRTEYVADRTNTVGTAFLGLTMECARCHDHKYDPISQKDYYSLFGFFNNVDESGQTSHFTQSVPVPALPLPSEDVDEQILAIQSQIASQEKAVEAAANASDADFEEWVTRGASLRSLPDPVLAYEFDILLNETTPALQGPKGKTVFDPLLVPGRFGNALSFDGESGVNLENVGIFSRSDPFTISFWMKAPDTLSTNVLVHRTQAALDAGSRGYELSLFEGRLLGQLAHMWPENSIRVVADEVVPANRWVHVSMTYDGSSHAGGIRLYQDCVRIETTTVRDNLYGPIRYTNLAVPVTIGYRFRDTGFKDGAIDRLKIYDQALTGLEIARVAGAAPSDNPTLLREYFLEHYARDFLSARQSLRSLQERLYETLATVPQIMVMREMAEGRSSFVLSRGQYDAKGEEVLPGVPEEILPWDSTFPRNRYGLAQWIFDSNNPLTARVAVNRFWQRYFGRGLVTTPEDFGNQGALPSHPELLDYLASSFTDSGWDMKELHRKIVTSGTYRQSSTGTGALLELDPDNSLLARGPRQRLSAEMVRDHVLAASGLLNKTVGGPSVRPYQPEGLWMEKAGIRYSTGTGGDLYRRSLYTFFKRTSPPPSMITFDLSTRDQSVMRRQQTATPMQALVLLNDEQYVEASRHIAERALEAPSLKEQITKAFRMVLTRTPSQQEIAILTMLFKDQYVIFSEDPDSALTLLTTGESGWDSGLDVPTLAAFTMLSSALLSYDEAIVKY